ncbi:uncharacterized protein [Chelonus insularis]|uniref:uncharacterized protein n=1 Tax=Chelonus insularis TaxID=460826 RepID=UPI00158F0C3B|nr:uncharacterized protein LOC118074715 [Chelonus insularis]
MSSAKRIKKSFNENIVKDSWIPEFRPLEDSCVPVIVDIETTGLGNRARIIQVAAKCGMKNFEVHILPKANITAQTSKVTGFTSSDGALFYRGQKVETFPSNVAARRFLDFLHELNSQILLVGHNIIRFDAPIICQWLNKHGLLKELCSLIFGMTDTLPLLRRDNIGKQEELAAKYLIGPEWDDIREKAHNATTDCILLQGLLEHFQINNNILKKKSLSTKDFFQQRYMAKKQRKNMSLVSELKPIVSRIMMRRMARHGLTIDKLKIEFLQHGREKIEACLKARVNRKPTVTANKRVIQKIIEFIQKLIDSEKETCSKVEK